MKLTAKNIEKVLLGIKVAEEAWEADEDIVTFNGKPIGSTISRAGRGIFVSCWPSLCREIAEHLADKFKPAEPKTDPHLQGQAEHIYDFYPKKVAKPAALRAILKQLKKYNADDLLEQTKRFAELWKDATKDQIQFLPHPATWYNQERFMDQIDIQGPKPGWKREPLRGENI